MVIIHEKDSFKIPVRRRRVAWCPLHHWQSDANNENVDITFSAHDAFLEKPSSGDAQSWTIGKSNAL